MDSFERRQKFKMERNNKNKGPGKRRNSISQMIVFNKHVMLLWVSQNMLMICKVSKHKNIKRNLLILFTMSASYVDSQTLL